MYLWPESNEQGRRGTPEENCNEIDSKSVELSPSIEDFNLKCIYSLMFYSCERLGIWNSVIPSDSKNCVTKSGSVPTSSLTSNNVMFLLGILSML